MDPSEKPTYYGESPDQGESEPEPIRAGKGFALLVCGGTRVLLSYGLLHSMRLDIPAAAANWAALCACQRAINAITCEASLGRTPATAATSKG